MDEYKNLQLLHKHCHDTKTEKDGSINKNYDDNPFWIVPITKVKVSRSGMRRKSHVPFWRRGRSGNTPIDSNIPKNIRPILAIDHTSWPRPDAVTLQERTIEHQATDIPGNRPITLGQGYSTIAWVPESEGSWALPLRHERITSWESPIDKAVWQLRQVSQYLPSRPIVLIDSEYGCAPFVLKTAGIQADKLMRLRSNLCLWGAPPPYSGKGCPRKHGEKFKLNDASTWEEPTETIEIDAPFVR